MRQSKTRRCEIVLHLGRKGSGKSYRAKREAERSSAPIVSVWDPRLEWAGPSASEPPRGRRVVVRDPGEFLRAQSASSAPLGRFVVWQLATAEFGTFARWARASGGLVVIDEAQLVAGTSGMHPAFLELVTTCRHSGASMLLCAQRAATLTPSLRAQVDVLRCWRTTEPRDLRWLEEAYGSAFADSCPKLSGHAFSEWKA